MNSLEKVRSEYLQHYRAAISRHRDGHEKFTPELLFELSDRVGLHRKLYRVDMIISDDGKNYVIEANLDQPTQIFETTEERERSSITVRPFVWNGAVFVTHDGGLADVDSWFLRWADIDDDNKGDDHGLGGVIHSLYVTEGASGLNEYSVDFGSAPIQAFDDFVDLLVAAGARRIEVSSPFLENQPANNKGCSEDGA
jgi:hypothetical protein